MATTAEFKNGLCLDFKNDLYVIVQFQHVKPGKGGAFVRTKLKSLTNGRVIENTFTAGEKVDIARVERRPHQFLYKDESGYNFMHNETYEQICIGKEIINAPDLLKDGNMLKLLFMLIQIIHYPAIATICRNGNNLLRTWSKGRHSIVHSLEKSYC